MRWGKLKEALYYHTIGRMRRRPRTSMVAGVLLLAWLFCLPRPIFRVPYSYTVEDQNGYLLSARIAADGQWRMYPSDALPEKYTQCLIEFEDRWFRWHPGVNPVSLASAAITNLRKGSVKRGGSTLTMQTIRLARGNPRRTVIEKLVEMAMATRLELTYSKNRILELYAAHAPFGGNIVGLDAAAWRYFHTRPADLSWAQCATLAVLPNSPGLIHPGRNRDALRAKRDRLLDQLMSKGVLSEETCSLAKSEPLPEQPEPIPNEAPHLLQRLANEAKKSGEISTRFITTISAPLQRQISQTLGYFAHQYRGNGVNNLSAVVISVEDGSVLAYCGNVPSDQADHHSDVDILASVRSTGSILKPFLYASALQDGLILPESLLPDLPSQMAGYKPENYLNTYDGAVTAKRALIRSLNVPFVMLLRDYGVARLQQQFGRLGLTTINKNAEHYGLSLVLGGAEANLVEVTNAYACMARTLRHFTENNSRYVQGDFFPARMSVGPDKASRTTQFLKEAPFLSAGVVHSTFEAMQALERPEQSGEWELFRTPRQVAWKTGTSFGFRDAWAVGVTPDYVVGIWVGNADGEGRPGLIGLHAAAPVLFRTLEQLPATGWFDTPYDDLARLAVCRWSGNRSGAHCVQVDTSYVPEAALQGPMCRHCTLLHLDSSGLYQVKAECESPDRMRHTPWFVLPADQEYYFKLKHPWYQSPPGFRSDCMAFVTNEASAAEMQITYPAKGSSIFVPKELDGSKGKVVLAAAHRRQDATIHWHLNDQYLGATRQFHEQAVQPPPGHYKLTLVDDKGLRVVREFDIL